MRCYHPVTSNGRARQDWNLKNSEKDALRWLHASSSGHNHTYNGGRFLELVQLLLRSTRISSVLCLLVSSLEECINKWELLSEVRSCTVFPRLLVSNWWFVHLSNIENGFREVWLEPSEDLESWKFQQGRQESAFSKVSTKLMSSLVTSWFLLLYSPWLGGWVEGSFVFDKKRMFVN